VLRSAISYVVRFGDKMAEGVNCFKDLKIWQVAIGLVKKVYEVGSKFPKDEMYGLTSQIRRSAISIPSNVAEGFRRQHNNEFKQFLYISLGNCAELETQTIIAQGLGYVSANRVKELLEDLDHVCRMKSKLVKKL
jgi:four helix bundle protein